MIQAGKRLVDHVGIDDHKTVCRQLQVGTIYIALHLPFGKIDQLNVFMKMRGCDQSLFVNVMKKNVKGLFLAVDDLKRFHICFI